MEERVKSRDERMGEASLVKPRIRRYHRGMCTELHLTDF